MSDLFNRIKETIDESAKELQSSNAGKYRAGSLGGGGGSYPSGKQTATEVNKGEGVDEVKKAAHATGKATHPQSDSKAKSSSSKKTVSEDEVTDETLDQIEETEDTVEETDEVIAEKKEESEDDSDDGKGEDKKGKNPFAKGGKGKSEDDSEDSDDDDGEEKSDGKKGKFPFNLKAKMKDKGKMNTEEHMNALFGSTEPLSEEFKSKAATIFEAAVAERELAIMEAIEEEYTEALAESLEEVRLDLVEKLDSYLDHLAEEWLEQNKVAIDTGLNLEIHESFTAGLRQLFLDNDIEVPEAKSDLVEELAARIQELETKINETTETAIRLKKENETFKKQEVVNQLGEGLSAVQFEKFKTLCESVTVSSLDEFKTKVQTIKESYNASADSKKTSTEKTQLNEGTVIDDETLDEGDGTNVITEEVSPHMQQIMAAMSKMTANQPQNSGKKQSLHEQVMNRATRFSK